MALDEKAIQQLVAGVREFCLRQARRDFPRRPHGKAWTPEEFADAVSKGVEAALRDSSGAEFSDILSREFERNLPQPPVNSGRRKF